MLLPLLWHTRLNYEARGYFRRTNTKNWSENDGQY